MSNKNLNMAFNLDGFEKISDIIFLDQPILTHLIKNERDYFKYLVDSENDYDIFLLLEVDKQSLLEYILDEVSLYSIIVNNKTIGTIFKEDFRGLIIDSYAINPNKIPEYYLPDEDSFLRLDRSFNIYYTGLIDAHNQGLYLQGLRNRAFYLKFEPTNPKHRNTFGFMELSNGLLHHVTSSYRSFAIADFNVEFNEKIGDQDKLKSTFGSLANFIDPRVVDVAFNSFEIGIAADNTMKDIEDKYLKEWAIELADKYKNIILDIDIDSKDAEEIVSKYNYDDRKKIFDPLISIINNKNVKLKIKNNKDGTYRKYTIEKEIQSKIVPDMPKCVKIDKNLELVSLTVVIDKNSKAKKKINAEKSLFTTMEATTVNITNKEFENNGILLDETINIPVKIESHGNYIILSAEYKGDKFSEKFSSDNLTYAINSLVNQIAKHYNLL